MSSDLESKLRTEFPSLFAGMRREVGCEDGWYQLIRELCLQLSEIEHVTGIRISVIQIKEKFGELRCYTSCDKTDIHAGLRHELWGEIIFAVISRARQRSLLTCEICGNKKGELREFVRRPGGMPWYQTLCDEHYEEAKNRKT